MTKTLTLTSEFFQNECAESFCKAILGNKGNHNEELIGFKANFSEPFIMTDGYEILEYTDVEFELDDSFSVDWACLEYEGELYEEFYSYDVRTLKLNINHLVTLQGVTIEEAGE